MVLDTVRDRSPVRRAEVWSNIAAEGFALHDAGRDFLDVTEGTFFAGVF